jgi:hypothetical protein
LKQHQADLAGVFVRRVAGGKGDALDKVLKATQGANVSPLVDVMDEQTVTMIRQFLAAKNADSQTIPLTLK